MSPEAQRIAIAKACGFKIQSSALQAPDYLNDLNAMHEAEKAITDDQWPKYRDLLHEMAFQACPKGSKWFRPACCTASQRAEAFLRVKKLWKD